ncbi:MAG: hypothetical protein DYG89_25905 [Caldilinea sp. CFX5]|nr:hypothetical protein [Caldilinea sp. CFX5]
MRMSVKLSRREMLKLSAGLTAMTLLAACAPQGNTAQEPAADQLLTLRVAVSQYGEKASKNVNDIVTPYVEKMFNVKFDAFFPPPGTSNKEFYALNKAAGTLPEIMVTGRQESLFLSKTGDFADMTDRLADMPSYMRWVEPKTFRRWLSDGRQYALPQIGIYGDDPALQGNIYYEGFNVWPLLIREDILTRLGYKLTPLAEIAKETTDKGIWPTFDQLGITPAIDTPEKFDELLKQIQAENIMVGDKPLTPLSSIYWSVFHLSSMMDNGHWRINEAGEVDGFLGLPGAHPYYKMWADWYRTDLLDKDYVTQKDDQLQEKWSTGRVAAGLYVPNLGAARQSLMAKDPTAMIRPVAWPKQDQKYGFFDLFETGFWTATFNNSIPDLDRIVAMIEWLNSDEGIDVSTWGPKEAGLYTTDASGKKLWKDEETRTNIMGNVIDTQNAEYYGIFNPLDGGFTSRVFFCMPMVTAPIKADPRFNYEPKLNIFDIVPRVLGKNTNMGYNTDGRACYGDGGENTTSVGDYFWSKFSNGEIAKLLTAKDEGEFEAGWAEIQDGFESDGNYSKAKADMEKWFAEFGPKA